MSRDVFRLALVVPAFWIAASASAADARRAELLNLVRQDCGSCHGLTMRGGLGPPLLPARLSERDDEAMVFTILNGRHGTPMPPWRDFLSEPEARWIVEVLKKGLPDER